LKIKRKKLILSSVPILAPLFEGSGVEAGYWPGTSTDIEEKKEPISLLKDPSDTAAKTVLTEIS
jgi:hypothetical protein